MVRAVPRFLRGNSASHSPTFIQKARGMSEATKILSVDDSNLTRKRFVAAPLREAGYEVVEAANGEEGLEALGEHQPACVITDLLMPIMDGFGFIEAARANGYAGPIVVVSADIQQSSRERVGSLGVAGFLNKPFERSALLDAVASAIASTASEECAACS